MEKHKIKRLGGYRYEVLKSGSVVGVVSVCRCGERSQRYQVQLESGQVLKEFTSVKKAALAALQP